MIPFYPPLQKQALPTVAVSYSAPAQRAAVLLPELSKLANVRLMADSEAGQEVLLVSVKDVPLAKLMERIAAASSCRWKSEPDGYTLVPDTAVRSKEESRETADRAKRIDGDIEEDLKQVSDPSKDKDESDPGSRATTELLRIVDTTTLAAMKPNDRIVWASNNPTLMQRLISEDVSPIASEWLSSYNSVIAKSPSTSKPINKPIYKLVMVAEREYKGFDMGDDQIGIGALAFDRGGTILLEGRTYVSAKPHEQDDEKPNQPDPRLNKPIAFSEASQEMNGFVNQMATSSALSFRPSSRLRALLSDPEQNEPLGLIVSDGLLQYANETGRQIVADVPDTWFLASQLDGIDKWKTLQDVKDALAGHKGVGAEDDGQFLTLRPERPAIERTIRVDRVALHKLISEANTDGCADLEAVSSFALTNPPVLSNPLELLYGMLMAPGLLTGNPEHSMSWEMLRFYGSLSAAQRVSLVQGTPLPFSSLSEEQRSHLVNTVFGASSNLQSSKDKDEGEDEESILGFFHPSGSESLHDYRREPTELMPNGLPAAGSIQGTYAERAALFWGLAGSVLASLPLGPKDVASFDSDTEHVKPATGRMGHNDILRLMLLLGPGIVQVERLHNAKLAKDQASVPLTALPADFKAEMDRQKAGSVTGTESGTPPPS